MFQKAVELLPRTHDDLLSTTLSKSKLSQTDRQTDREVPAQLQILIASLVATDTAFAPPCRKTT
jgi:hypothetical protein